MVRTHYCALGMQFHWVVDLSGLPKTLKFNFKDGINVDPTKDMHEGSFSSIDDDHLETNRQAYQYGKPTDVHTVHMKLVRKK